MSVFKESPRTHLHVRTPVMVGVILALVIVLSALFNYLTRQPTSPRTTPAETAAPAPTTPAPAPLPREESSARATTPSSAPARKTTRPAPEATPPTTTALPSLATLTVESDVPGASVFVDRKFVGTAPVTLDDLEPGSKQVNLVADGFDGVSRTMDVAAGSQTVSMRFKEVRLDKRVPVTHKHGAGSCTGELIATVDGLRYVTSNAKDGGTVPFSALEQFEVNYLEKNLRVKQRGGRTWNFTDANANADALFVFHRDVESARKKLAQGYAAVR